MRCQDIYNLSSKLTMTSLIGYVILISSINGLSQGNFTWFESHSSQFHDKDVVHACDCYLQKESMTADNKEIKEFEAFPLFIYNHPQIRKWMKNEFMMTATARVNKTGNNHFVIIEYAINSEKAKTNYGNLEKNGKMKVTLTDGEYIYLENIERDRGKVRRTAKQTKYTGTFALDKDDIKSLKKHAIDKIAVLWEEGVEEYQIQNIDLIKQQLNCLETI